MTLKMKTLAAAAALSLTGISFSTAAMFTTGTAQASTPGCAFTNGCGTLKGTDANGSSVAMDAKGKNKTEILIGYADNAGDGATSFDSDLHYGRGTKTTTYADTGFTLSPTFTSFPCNLTTDHFATPNTTTVPGQLTAAGTGNVLVVESTTGTATASPASGASLTLGGAGTITVGQQYASDGTSCVASYTGTVSGSSISGVTGPDTASLTYPTSPGGSTWTFLDFDTGGTFKFTGLPAASPRPAGR